MPNLATIELTKEPQSVIVYGPPKSGKTLLMGMLAQGYRLHWFDLENGSATLFQLPQELHSNIELYKIRDTKDQPNAINSMLKIISGDKVTICDAHGKSTCTDCLRNKESFSEINLSNLSTEKDIVVVDSFTQLTSSANAHATRGLNRDKNQNEEFSHWRYQGTLLEKYLDYVQNSTFNSVTIAHEMGVDQVDGTEKVMPAGGTKNFARNVAKYFGHIIYCDVKNSKHRAASSTTAHTKILTGSRTNIEVASDPHKLVLDIFRTAKPLEQNSSSKVTEKVAAKASSPTRTTPNSVMSKLNKK